MRRFVRENALSLAFGVLFLVVLVLQSLAGWHGYNEQQLEHHGQAVAWPTYVTSSAFGVEVLENWQSEYLQFTLFILVTVWLVQRGSPESKPVGEEGTESEREQQLGRYAQPDSPLWARVGGVRTLVYPTRCCS